MRDGSPEIALQRQPGRLLTLRSGGWVLILAGILMLGLVLWQVMPLIELGGPRLRGDGEHVDSYGFDLATCLVPKKLLAACGMPKDGMAAMVEPVMMPGEAVPAFNKAMRGKYLLPSDRVIGVVIGGEARAYPIRVMNWHEVANDIVGGVPIAVTYSPLCDSTVVFDRRVGGETLELAFSGLLYNSNQLLFDRRPKGVGESLWSQLQFRAVAGPAAEQGRTLRVLPSVLVQWGEWLAKYPDTLVVRPGMKFVERYKRQPYTSYYGSEDLHFAVEPMPPAGGLDNKAQVIAILDETSGRSQVLSVADLLAKASASPGGVVELQDCGVRFICNDNPASLFVESLQADRSITAIPAFWFAWHAMHPEDVVTGIAPPAVVTRR